MKPQPNKPGTPNPGWMQIGYYRRRIGGMMVVWGLMSLLFALKVFYDRAVIALDGKVVSREVGKYWSGPGRFFTDYTLETSSGAKIVYRADNNDPSLSRDLPIGCRLVKRKWHLAYTVDERRITDFPGIFYPIVASSGLVMIFCGGILFLRPVFRRLWPPEAGRRYASDWPG